MGYRSNVYLKTTTEGYLVMKQLNDSITREEEKPLLGAEIQKTKSGFYKITFDDIKWYEGTFKDVDNFMKGLELMRKQDIPYSFIRIGEESDDIEHKMNYTDDMPDEILNFEPVVDVNDDDWSCYEDVEDDKDHIKKIMFDLFNKYEECDDIKDALRDMNSDGVVTDEEYDYAILHWDELLNEWEKRGEK